MDEYTSIDSIADECGLSKRDVSILDMRFGEKKTLEDIGWYHNVTKERIRQLINKAKAKLAKAGLEVVTVHQIQRVDSTN
jgi:DNA-directed RNA polymerase sigma subunit (sigma70/sigma32)